jgi:hypothetical protein
MKIMKKSLLLVACLALPLVSFAADNKPAHAKGASAPAHGKSARAPAPAASSVSSREAVHASKMRGSANGACQKKATDQKLAGEERKAFMVTCMKV